MITVLLVTYDRPNEIREVIHSLKKHLVYDGKINWHIADDSSPGNYISDIVRDFPELSLTATSTKRKGWGANVNKALNYIRNDFIFLCEDDYVATKDIDLNSGIALLSTNTKFASVRYDGLSGHIGLSLTVDEVNTPIGKIDFLEIDKARSSHLNVYSNRPHLRHRRYHDIIGMYDEGKTLGETEESYAMRVKSSIDGPKVAILHDGIERAFVHIGKSRQGTEFDVVQ